jgi:hypothetical protein
MYGSGLAAQPRRGRMVDSQAVGSSEAYPHGRRFPPVMNPVRRKEVDDEPELEDRRPRGEIAQMEGR